MRRQIRSIALWLLVSLTGIVAIALLCLATGPGQRVLVAIAARLLSEPGATVRIEGLRGSLFGTGILGRVSIEDAKGQWLEVRGIAFRWQPIALLTGKLDVEDISIVRIEMKRRPEDRLADRSASPTAGLQLPLAVRLGHGTIDEIVLNDRVLGSSARLTATLNLSVADLNHGLSGSIRVQRVDATRGELTGKFSYRLANRALAVEIAASESAGGIVATLLESPGLPPLAATLKADGSLNDWRGKFQVDSEGAIVAQAEARAWRRMATLNFSASVDGHLAAIAPQRFRDMLAGRIEGRVSGDWSASNRITIERADLRSEAMQLSVRGMADMSSFLASGEASLSLARGDKQSIRLPVSDKDEIAIGTARARLSLPEGTTHRPVSLSIHAAGLTSAYGAIGDMSIRASAVQPTTRGRNWRRLDAVQIAINATGLKATNQKLERVVLPAASLLLQGKADADSITLDTLTGELGSIRISGTGEIRGKRLSGRIDGSIGDLSMLTPLVGRDLGGNLTIEGKGHFGLVDETAQFTAQGTITDPRFGLKTIENVIAGHTTFSAEVRTTVDGSIKITDARVDGRSIEARLTGGITRSGPNGEINVKVRDLPRLHPALAGGLEAIGKLEGGTQNMRMTFELSSSGLRWRNKPVELLKVRVRATETASGLDGNFEFDTRYAGQQGQGQARFARIGDSGIQVDDLALQFGRSALRGWVRLTDDADIRGDLALDAPDIGAFSSISGLALAGRASARFLAPLGNGQPKAKLLVKSTGLVIGTSRIDRIEADAAIENLLGNVRGTGAVRLAGGSFEGLEVSELTASIARETGPASFRVTGRSHSVRLAASGTATSRNLTKLIDLQTLRIEAPGTRAALSKPSKISFDGDTITLERMKLMVGDGRLEVSGRAGKSLAVAANWFNLPAALADVISPDIAGTGRLGGRIDLTGTADRPKAVYDLTWREASISATRRAGLPALSISAHGQYADGQLNSQGRVTGAGGLSVAVAGTARIGGRKSLDLRANGQVPLGIVDTLLAGRGTRAKGLAKADIAITGDPEQPRLLGSVTVSGGEVRDPATGIRLNNLRMSARLNGNAVAIERLEAAAPLGGRIDATGIVALDMGAGFPADIRIKAISVRIDDGDMLAGTLSGDVGLRGPLRGSVLASGKIVLGRFDIILPDRMPASITELDIKHAKLSESERRRLGIGELDSGTAPDLPIRLDLQLVSDGKLFVRGRGIDAQLGGDLRLTGDTLAPVAEGEFRMERGRIAIAGRRLEFNRGAIGFTGSFDPNLAFEAMSQAEGTVITTRVSGRASNPVLKFTSSPDLPEDEVIARLLFNKSLAKLSPVQIAQLASEIDRLGGVTSGTGVLDQLRKSAGIDALDVTTDKKGNAAISAGRYIGDKVYLGVQQNTATSENRVVIDLDIMKNVKARGEATGDGRSKIGIGVEWNY